MSKENKDIIITRESGWYGMAVKINIVVDDEFSISLANGESAKIPVAKDKTECTITTHAFGNAGNNIFTIKNFQNVKEIKLKISSSGCKCSVVYNNGLTLDALDKSSGATTNRMIFWIIMIIFLIIPLCKCIEGLIIYMFFN